MGGVGIVMLLFFDNLLFLIGLCAPALCGWGALRLFGVVAERGWGVFERFVLSFLLGWVLFGGSMTVLGLSGRFFTFWAGLLVLFVLSASTWWIGGRWRFPVAPAESLFPPRRRERWLSMPVLLWIAAAICAACVIGLSDVDSIPMMGIWGYKARVFQHDARIPLWLFESRGLFQIHQSYPLLYPVMAAWCAICAGTDFPGVVVALPMILGALCCGSIFVVARRLGAGFFPAVLAVAAYSSCRGFQGAASSFYAENLLTLYVLWGVFFSARAFANLGAGKGEGEGRGTAGWDLASVLLGLVLLGGGCQVKNEGALYYAAAVLAVLAMVWSRRPRNWRGVFGMAALVLALGIVLALPWRLFMWWLGVGVRDFALKAAVDRGWEGTWEIGGKIGKEFWLSMGGEPSRLGAVWLGAPLILLLAGPRFWRRGGVLAALFIVFAVAAVFMMSFFLSTRELDWHLTASVNRILLPGAAVLWAFAATTLSKRGG